MAVHFPLINERFAVDRQVSEGGMGAIFHGLDRTTGAAVAVKTLTMDDEASKERFLREAEVLASIHHPTIVRYVAHGLSAHGEPYLVMEWLEGEDLLQRLRRAELSLREAIVVGRRAAEALAHAHRAGLIHRDVKPGNLFLPGKSVEQAKLIDFGLVRWASAHSNATRTGVAVGTPGYMAPEQAMGKPDIDARADVFSLGCVLYRCLTGQKPFPGEHVVAVLTKLVFETPPRPCELQPEIPDQLDDLLVRMMAKAPADRPANAAVVEAELRAIPLPDSDTRPSFAGVLWTAISDSEQRLTSVVVVGTPERDGPNRTVARPDPDRFAELQPLLAPFGAELAPLANGLFVAVLAKSGEPVDQAANAARCALALRSAMPRTPIALATGRNVLGSGHLGEVADGAAALFLRGLRAASTGDSSALVRVDDVTAGLLDQRFEIGGDHVSLFVVRERQPFELTARKLIGRETTCVGRDRELALLDATFQQTVSDEVARVTLVLAPAGYGKSRLRYEFLRRLQAKGEPIEVWMARGDRVSLGSPFRMVSQILQQAAGLQDGEPAAIRFQKLRARVHRRLSGTVAEHVAEMLGEVADARTTLPPSVQLAAAREDPQRMADQLRLAWEDFVTAESVARPLLIVLEDLHWGDLPSVQLVDAALRVLADRPLFVLALARPEVLDLFPGLWRDRGVEELRLVELTKKSSERLVRQVLGSAADPDLVRTIVDRAGGNAFFIEEMVRAVVDGRGSDLPDTVLACVESRLDRLGTDERRALRAASVFGQVFWERGVAALVGGTQRPASIARWLSELERRELISLRRQCRFPGEKEYVFQHAIVRDAAYAMLTEQDRVLGHRVAAGWLEKAGERDAPVLAAHYEHGGERTLAAGHYLRAAEQALDGNDFDATLAQARRGIDCGPTDEQLGALNLLMAEAHRWRGRNVEALACAKDAGRLLRRGSERWLRAAAELANLCSRMARLDDLRAVAQELLDASAVAHKVRYIDAAARTAIQLMHAGELGAADLLLDSFDQALTDLTGDPAKQGSLDHALAIRAMYAGDVGEFMRLARVAAESFERAGDLRFAGLMRANVAYAHMELGGYKEAEAILRDVLAAAQRMHISDLVTGAYHNLGLTLARLGRVEEGRVYEERALAASVAQRNTRLESGCRTYLAIILYMGCDFAGSEREARAAADIATVAPSMRAHALGILSRALLQQGKAMEALAAARSALDFISEQVDIEEGEMLVRVAYIKSHVACGDHAEAARAAKEAHDRLHRKAAKISDLVLRERFLSGVPEHAVILDVSASLLAPLAEGETMGDTKKSRAETTVRD